MKSVLFTAFALTALLPATTLANDAIQDVLPPNQECQQLQAELDHTIKSGRKDVTLAATIKRTEEQLVEIQAQLLDFGTANSRLLPVVNTFNQDAQSVIRQLSVEHTQAKEIWVTQRDEAYTAWHAKCFPESH
jgi:hypothetical protein